MQLSERVGSTMTCSYMPSRDKQTLQPKIITWDRQTLPQTPHKWRRPGTYSGVFPREMATGAAVWGGRGEDKGPCPHATSLPPYRHRC